MNPLSQFRKIRWSTLWAVLGPFLILLFVLGLFAVLLDEFDRESFFSGYNVRTILIQTVIVAIGALGMTMIIVSGGIDLSVGSVIALTSVVGALLIQQEHGLPTVVLAAILTGGMVGLINGSIIARFGMAPFIVTLGMLGMARGTAKWLAQNQTVNVHGSKMDGLMTGLRHDSWTLPPGVIIAFSLALLMVLVMRYSVFGRYVFAIGSNEATARLCGIRTRLVKMSIYAFAGLFFGLAGLMQLSRMRQGDPTAALGIELDVIAAVVIGGASLSGGTGSILGSMIGALTMAVLRAGSQFKDWPNYVQEIIIGAVIIFAVGLDRLRQRKAAGKS
jgi:ribose transport system permease protein